MVVHGMTAWKMAMAVVAALASAGNQTKTTTTSKHFDCLYLTRLDQPALRISKRQKLQQGPPNLPEDFWERAA